MPLQGKHRHCGLILLFCFWSLYIENRHKTLCNHVFTLPSANIPIKCSSLEKGPDVIFIWIWAGFIFSSTCHDLSWEEQPSETEGESQSLYYGTFNFLSSGRNPQGNHLLVMSDVITL